MAVIRPHTVDTIAGSPKLIKPPASAYASSGGSGQRALPLPPPPARVTPSTSIDTDPQARMLAAISGQTGLHGCGCGMASVNELNFSTGHPDSLLKKTGGLEHPSSGARGMLPSWHQFAHPLNGASLSL
jgi:hypothetical protein